MKKLIAIICVLLVIFVGLGKHIGNALQKVTVNGGDLILIHLRTS